MISQKGAAGLAYHISHIGPAILFHHIPPYSHHIATIFHQYYCILASTAPARMSKFSKQLWQHIGEPIHQDLTRIFRRSMAPPNLWRVPDVCWFIVGLLWSLVNDFKTSIWIINMFQMMLMIVNDCSCVFACLCCIHDLDISSLIN